MVVCCLTVVFIIISLCREGIRKRAVHFDTAFLRTQYEALGPVTAEEKLVRCFYFFIYFLLMLLLYFVAGWRSDFLARCIVVRTGMDRGCHHC